MAHGTFGGGAGTVSNPYIIEDGKDLNAIRYLFQSSSSTYKYFKITRDIDVKFDLDGAKWKPIEYFYGSIDGNNHIIYNLQIQDYTSDNIGFISTIRWDNTDVNTPIFKDLCFMNIDIDARKGVGCLGGYANISVTNNALLAKNVSVFGKIKGKHLSGVINNIDYTYNGDISLRFLNNCYFDLEYTTTSDDSTMSAICSKFTSTYAQTITSNITNTIIRNKTSKNCVLDNKIKLISNMINATLTYSVGSVVVNECIEDENCSSLTTLTYDEFNKANAVFDNFLYQKDNKNKLYWVVDNNGIEPSLLRNNFILIKSDEGFFTYQNDVNHAGTHLKKLNNTLMPEIEVFRKNGIDNTYLLRRDFWNEVREKLHNVTIYNTYSNIYNKNVTIDSLHMDRVEDNEHTELDNKNIYRYSYTFTGKEEFTVKNSNIE